jgi:hypothetical protein
MPSAITQAEKQAPEGAKFPVIMRKAGAAERPAAGGLAPGNAAIAPRGLAIPRSGKDRDLKILRYRSGFMPISGKSEIGIFVPQ